MESPFVTSILVKGSLHSANLFLSQTIVWNASVSMIRFPDLLPLHAREISALLVMEAELAKIVFFEECGCFSGFTCQQSCSGCAILGLWCPLEQCLYKTGKFQLA